MLQSLKASRGSSLIIVILYAHIILLLVLHMASLFITTRQISHNDGVRAQVRYAAEAGLYLAGERRITDPASPPALLYNLDGIRVQVTITEGGAHEAALSSHASLAPYYVSTALMTMDTATGKIIDWGVH
ncbi:hypothetical protein [Aneurinibacillus tyrosinisolvens]|uniref:hypothetical protein n=1 Tax=Aneurinibacillus tyrosinisolvens TaxID=1443435 RepID=UPI00063F91FF|nr:hypothetical protein [Aneurinibacillus tyrosinisolvens]